jgi:hypothetical protein
MGTRARPKSGRMLPRRSQIKLHLNIALPPGKLLFEGKNIVQALKNIDHM